jgi:hypothetical protein
MTVRVTVPHVAHPEQTVEPLQPPQLLQPQLRQAQAGDSSVESTSARAGNSTNKRRFIKASSFQFPRIDFWFRTLLAPAEAPVFDKCTTCSKEGDYESWEDIAADSSRRRTAVKQR